jgi:bacteriorhodopsin
MQSIYVVLSGALVALLFTGGMMFSKKPEQRKLGMNAFLVITVLMAFLWYFGSNS